MNTPLYRRLFLTGLFAGAILIGGCATARQQVLKDEMFARSVDASIINKVDQRRPLSLEDIEQSAARSVPDSALMGYIRETGAVYHLTKEDVDRLREAKVSDSLVDYLLTTPARYRPRVYSYHGVYHPYPRHYRLGPRFHFRRGFRRHHHFHGGHRFHRHHRFHGRAYRYCY